MTFRPRLTAAFTLLFLVSALPMAWLLREDSWSRLEFTRSEISALQPLEALRGSMLAAVEDLLSGEAIAPEDRRRLLEFSRTWATEAKEQGHSRSLILDPRLDLYHLAYLCTVKLPERFQALTELASLEGAGKAGAGRGPFLRQSLLEQLEEETRALELAGQGQDSGEPAGLMEKNGQRRKAFADYAPGKMAQLREAARQDADLWSGALEALGRRLRALESEQRFALRMRQALAFGLPALLLLAGWLLMRRFAEIRSGEAKEGISKNYELLFRSIPLPIFIYSLETRRFVNANPAAAAMLKCTPEEIPGMGLAHFVPPGLREEFSARLKKRDPKADTHEIQRIQDMGGRPIDVEVLARYIELDGRPLRLVMMNDITETVAAQEAVKRNEARFRALCEDSSDALLLMSPDGKVLYASQSVRNVAGYEPAESVGTYSNSFLHAEDRDKVWTVFQQALGDPGRTCTFDARVLHKSGRYIHASARLRNMLGDPHVGALVLNYHDVSAEVEARQQLLRYERLAAIGQTAAGLAHEVRNPLAAITMSAEFLKSQLADRGSLLADLDSILRQSERLKHLVHEVLERSRSEELRLSEASGAEMLRSALKAAQIRFGQSASRIEAVLDIPESAPRLKADMAQMERVLCNLILNAMQAMPTGGALTLGLKSAGGWVHFEVSDNGPGIPDDRIARIFEPFFTTKETGSGLGLWICRSIVEQHGGRIAAANLAPRGCRFTVSLPLNSPAGQA